MKIGSTFNHELYGPLKITGKRYSRLGNKSLWIGTDEQGEEHELDGSEKPAKPEKSSPQFLKEASELLGMTQGPKGEDADEDYIIEAVIPRVLEQIRLPEDGAPGKDGADADVELVVREILPLVMERMPKPEKINEASIVSKVLSRIRIPQDGKDGEKGKDGSPDTPVQVKEKLETLKGDERLDASAIKNLPKAAMQFGGGDSYTGLAKVDSQGTPGTLEEKLVAGTNVTITKVNDTLRIDSSGGGGGGTGTVDTIVAGNNIDVDATDPANPIVSVEDSFVLNTGDTMSGNLAITIANSGNALAATIVQNDTTNNPRAVSITNAGTGTSLFIDANGNTGTSTSTGGALLLDTTGSTGAGLTIYSNQATPASGGRLVSVRADNATFDQNVFEISNDGSGDALKVVNAGAGRSLFIDANADSSTSTSVGGSVLFENTGNAGLGVLIYSNNASPLAGGNLLTLRADNALFSEEVMEILNDGLASGLKITCTNTAGSATNIRLDGPAPQIEFVETDQASPAGKFEIGVNGNLFYLASRNAGDSSFEKIIECTQLASGGVFRPSANDTVSLGQTSLNWSDLFLASGGVINWNAGDYTATHSAGLLSLSGGLIVNNNATTVDFQVKGDTDTHLLFADTDGNWVGVNQSVWDSWAKLYVNGGARFSDDFRFQKGSGEQVIARLNSSASGATGFDLKFEAGNRDMLMLRGSGALQFGNADLTEMVFNENGNDYPMRFEGDTDANLLYLDAVNDRIGVGTSAPNSKFHTSGSVSKKYLAITALRTLDATDHIVDCTSGTFTVTLPTAVGITGREYVVKNSGTGVITIDGNGSETIDGQTTWSLPAQYDSITVVSDGANWIIIGKA